MQSNKMIIERKKLNKLFRDSIFEMLTKNKNYKKHFINKSNSNCENLLSRLISGQP